VQIVNVKCWVICICLQNSAVSGIAYDHIYPYLHNTLKAAVKPVGKFYLFMICAACVYCICDICDFSKVIRYKCLYIFLDLL